MTTYRTDERLIYNEALRQVSATNKTIARIYLESLERVESKMSTHFVKVMSLESVNVAELARLEVLQNSIYAELQAMNVKIERAISSGFLSNYKNTYYKTGYNIETEINLGRGFQHLTDDYVLNYAVLPVDAIKSSLDERIAGHTFKDRLKRDRDVLQFKIREAVASTLIEGLSPRDLSKSLKGIDDIFVINKNKAIMTSRTELLRAYSIGQDESVNHAKDAGVEFDYEWSATLDDRTRLDHQILDKSKPDRIEEDGMPVFVFSSGGQTSSPRLSGIAKQDINCRCRRLNLPFEIEPTARVAKLSDGEWQTIPSNQSYTAWVANLAE